MARYERKLPPPDIDAARSWRHKFIRDAFENSLGLVIDVRETDEGIRLVARFPGGSERLIALEPTADHECLNDEDRRARYRPPSEEDVSRLKALGVSSVE